MTQLNKIKTIPRKKITDHRGWFLKAIDGYEKDLPQNTGEIYLTSAIVGQAKGGHYHPKAQEWFTLIKGCAILKMQDVQTGEVIHVEMNAETPVTVYIPPMVAHLVINNSDKEDFILLAYTDLLYNPADTIPYQL